MRISDWSSACALPISRHACGGRPHLPRDQPGFPLLCAVANFSSDDLAHARPALRTHHRLGRVRRLLHAVPRAYADLAAQRAGGAARMAFGLALKPPSRARIDPVRRSLRAPDLVDALANGERTFAGAKSTESRSEEHTSELQSLMRISYAVFCLKKKNKT